MQIPIILDNFILCKVDNTLTASEIRQIVTEELKLDAFYLLQNGKKLENVSLSLPISVCLRVCGGKGGFGSMLRAIGAQIEKTTNREACRDLSGRRLRDINEEKRLKEWLEKQKDKTTDAYEAKKKKLERLLQQPKHEFQDKEYEKSRSELTSNVNEAIEEGFKKTQTATKRKSDPTKEPPNKKKSTLWIAEDLSSSSETDSDDDNDDNVNVKKKSTCVQAV